MPPPPEKIFDASMLDLNLPVPDAPLPPFHNEPLAVIYAACEEYAKRVPLDEKYWEWSLAGKSPEPFVM